MYILPVYVYTANFPCLKVVNNGYLRERVMFEIKLMNKYCSFGVI